MIIEKYTKVTKRYELVHLLFLFLLFVFGMNFPLPNFGGKGFNLPHNVMVGAFIVVTISLSIVREFHTNTIVLSKMQLGIFLLFLSLILPGLFNYHSESGSLVLIVGPLVVAFLFFRSVEQLVLSKKSTNAILYLVCLSVLLQVVYGLLQQNFDLSDFALYLHDNSRPVGIFAQPNVMGSYMATGVILALYLLSNSELACLSLKSRIFRVVFLSVTIIGALYVISSLSSRAATLGLLVGLILLFIGRWRFYRSNKKILSIFIVIIVLLSFYNFNKVNVVYNKTVSAITSIFADSTEKRLSSRLVISKVSLRTYLKAPWLGHGLGGLEKAYQDEAYLYNLEKVNTKNLLNIFIDHPHNEIAYWGIQSGIIAILGLLIFLVWYLLLLFSQGWQHGLTWLAILSPMGLHTQVSYPFYLSFIHFIVFILLLAVSVRHHSFAYHLNTPVFLKRMLMLVGLLVIVSYSFFTYQVLKSGLSLGLFKYTGLVEEQYLSLPLKNVVFKKEAETFKKYFEFQRSVKRNDLTSVLAYEKWLIEQIKYNEGLTYYHNLIVVYVTLRKRNKAIELLRYLKKRHPYDRRKLNKMEKELHLTVNP